MNKILILSPNNEIETFKNNTLTSLPSNSEGNFIEHGIDKGVTLDLTTPLNKRSFIEQEYESLGSGRVFKKTINSTEISIKKVTIT